MSREQYEKAERLLSNPSAYPGLVQRKYCIQLFRVWHYPSFSPYTSLSVIKCKNDLYVRRVILDQRPDIVAPELITFGSEAPLSNDSVSSLISQLKKFSFAPFIEVNTVGIDGETNGVEWGSYMSSTKMQWWCNPPSEWQELASWHKLAINTLNEYLPKHPLLELNG